MPADHQGAGNIEQHGHGQFAPRWGRAAADAPVIKRGDGGIGARRRRSGRRWRSPGPRARPESPAKASRWRVDHGIGQRRRTGSRPRAGRPTSCPAAKPMAKRRGRRHQVGPHQAPEIDRHQRQQRRRHQPAEQRDRQIGRISTPESRTATAPARPGSGHASSVPARSRLAMASRSTSSASSAAPERGSGWRPPSIGRWAARLGLGAAWRGRLRRRRSGRGARRRWRGRLKPGGHGGKLARAAGGRSSGGLAEVQYLDILAGRGIGQKRHAIAARPSPTTVPMGRPGGRSPPSPELTTWSPGMQGHGVRERVERRHRRCCRRP